jgi:hypothetical protein
MAALSRNVDEAVCWADRQDAPTNDFGIGALMAQRKRGLSCRRLHLSHATQNGRHEQYG